MSRSPLFLLLWVSILLSVTPISADPDEPYKFVQKFLGHENADEYGSYTMWLDGKTLAVPGNGYIDIIDNALSDPSSVRTIAFVDGDVLAPDAEPVLMTLDSKPYSKRKILVNGAYNAEANIDYLRVFDATSSELLTVLPKYTNPTLTLFIPDPNPSDSNLLRHSAFGATLASFENFLLVGAENSYGGSASLPNVGVAYLYSLEESDDDKILYDLSSTMVPLEGDEGDLFGWSLSIACGEEGKNKKKNTLCAIAIGGIQVGSECNYMSKPPLDTTGLYCGSGNDADANKNRCDSWNIINTRTNHPTGPGYVQLYLSNSNSGPSGDSSPIKLTGTTNGDAFGFALAMFISGSKGTLAVGAPYADNFGSVTLFTFTGESIGAIKLSGSPLYPAGSAGTPTFGWSLTMNKDFLFVGAPRGLNADNIPFLFGFGGFLTNCGRGPFPEDEEPSLNGRVYAYNYSTDSISSTPAASFSSDKENHNEFGFSVIVSSDVLAISEPQHPDGSIAQVPVTRKLPIKTTYENTKVRKLDGDPDNTGRVWVFKPSYKPHEYSTAKKGVIVAAITVAAGVAVLGLAFAYKTLCGGDLKTISAPKSSSSIPLGLIPLTRKSRDFDDGDKSGDFDDITNSKSSHNLV